MGLYEKIERSRTAHPKSIRPFTYADFKAWELKEGERFELIYGRTFSMAGANEQHQAIIMELASQFHNFLRGKTCKVYPSPIDVRLFYKGDDSDDTVVQPDIIIICDEKKRGYEGCRGVPDLIVEILSPSDTAIEMERKLRLYRKAKVREYWVIDPENNWLMVYHFPEDKIATTPYGNTGSVPVSILPGLSIKLDPIFSKR